MLSNEQHLITGLVIGMIMSAPIGPVNFLCFHRTLHRGLTAGMMVGLGATLADGIFASIAIFGLKFASQFIENNIGIMQVVGGLLIIGFGLYLLRHKPLAVPPPHTGKQKTWRGFLTGVALVLTNPGNFFGFAAMFSGITDVITGAPSWFHGVNFIIGVVLGALLWWSLFTSLVWFMRGKITQTTLVKINRISGALILLCGILLVGRYAIDYLPLWSTVG